MPEHIKRKLEEEIQVLEYELNHELPKELKKAVAMGDLSENAADWKDRFKDNSDKMRTGSLLDVAIVLKGLLLLGQTKSLSFREKKMLERTRYLLVSELAMSKNVEESVIEDLLDRALTKSKLRFPDASAVAV